VCQPQPRTVDSRETTTTTQPLSNNAHFTESERERERLLRLRLMLNECLLWLSLLLIKFSLLSHAQMIIHYGATRMTSQRNWEVDADVVQQVSLSLAHAICRLIELTRSLAAMFRNHKLRGKWTGEEWEREKEQLKWRIVVARRAEQ
jgi:hypothetical protein